LICLQEEMEFIEMYLSLQDRRTAGQVRQDIVIEPRLYDALVPTMILQPVVENAYVHGLSRVSAGGLIQITAKGEGGQLCISVRNSGVGLKSANEQEANGMGIGLANIEKRLRLHFGEKCRLTIQETSTDLVEVKVMIPLIFAAPDEVGVSGVSGVKGVS